MSKIFWKLEKWLYLCSAIKLLGLAEKLGTTLGGNSQILERVNIKLHNLLKGISAATRHLLVLLLCVLNAFVVRAQGNSQVRVHFPFDNAVVSSQYMQNASALAALDSLVAANGQDLALEVISYASPEGNYNYNVKLASRRAEAFRKYIINHYPSITVTVNPCGESWDDLRANVVADTRLEADVKEKILNIIDSSAEPDAKERQLKAISAYKSLYRNYFRSLRYAEVSFAGVASNVETTPAEPTVQETEPAEESDVTVPDLPVIEDPVISVGEPDVQVSTDSLSTDFTVEPALPAIDQPDIQVGEPDVQVGTDTLSTGFSVEPAQPITFPSELVPSRNMIAAVKTNLLFDAVTALNVEVEVPIGKRYSVMVEDVFPWWETGNKYCFQYWEMGVEGRFWFKPWERKGTEKLRGFFAGPYVMSGKYDFQYDRSINYQGEFWSAGLTAGYSVALGKKKNVNLEMSLSMGYMESPFRHYLPDGGYTKLLHDPARDGKFYNIFIYPTKAKVSLVVPIGVTTWHKKEVNHD